MLKLKHALWFGTAIVTCSFLSMEAGSPISRDFSDFSDSVYVLPLEQKCSNIGTALKHGTDQETDRKTDQSFVALQVVGRAFVVMV